MGEKILNKKVGVGIGVMVFKDGKILLGKRHEDPIEADSALHGEGTWTMPGGKLDFGGEPKEEACRELFEETGIKAVKDKLKIISVGNEVVADAHFVTLGFLCEDFEGEPKIMEPDEITEWSWFSLDDLPRPMYFPSEKMIKNYLAGEIYRY